MAEVLKGGKVVFTFREGDYFGEIALLSEMPRTADVRAVTDCMLLSLSLIDFEHVLGVFPEARERIRGAAQARYKELLGVSGEAARAPAAEKEKRMSTLAGPAPSPPAEHINENRLSKLMKSYGLSRGSVAQGCSPVPPDTRRDSHRFGRHAIKAPNHRRNTTTKSMGQNTPWAGFARRRSRDIEQKESPQSARTAEAHAFAGGVTEAFSRRPSAHVGDDLAVQRKTSLISGIVGSCERKSSLTGAAGDTGQPNDVASLRVRRASMRQTAPPPPSLHSLEHGLLDKLNDATAYCARRSIGFAAPSDSSTSLLGDLSPSAGEDVYSTHAAASSPASYTPVTSQIPSARSGSSDAPALAARKAKRVSKEVIEQSGLQTGQYRCVTQNSSSQAASEIDEAAKRLFRAIEDGDAQAVDAFIKDADGGGNLEARDANGNTALILAAEGEVECVRFLLEGGAAVNVANDEGKTPLNIAIEYQDSAIVQMLVNAGASISKRSVLLLEASASEVRDVLTHCVESGKANITDDAAAELRMITKSAEGVKTGAGPKRRAQSAGPETIMEASSFRERDEGSSGGSKSRTADPGEAYEVDDGQQKLSGAASSRNSKTGGRRNSLVNFFFKRKIKEAKELKTGVQIKDLDRASSEDSDAPKGFGVFPRISGRRQSTSSIASLDMDSDAIVELVARSIDSSLDKKLRTLRESIAQDMRQRDHVKESLDRMENLMLMLATKVESVGRQLHGEKWM